MLTRAEREREKRLLPWFVLFFLSCLFSLSLESGYALTFGTSARSVMVVHDGKVPRPGE